MIEESNETTMSLNPEELAARLDEAEALLRHRGVSVLVQNAYGPSKTAIWTGMVKRLNGMKHDQTGKPITLICLVGGGQVFADMAVEEAHALLMAGPTEAAAGTIAAAAIGRAAR